MEQPSINPREENQPPSFWSPSRFSNDHSLPNTHGQKTAECAAHEGRGGALPSITREHLALLERAHERAFKAMGCLLGKERIATLRAAFLRGTHGTERDTLMGEVREAMRYALLARNGSVLSALVDKAPWREGSGGAPYPMLLRALRYVSQDSKAAPSASRVAEGAGKAVEGVAVNHEDIKRLLSDNELLVALWRELEHVSKNEDVVRKERLAALPSVVRVEVRVPQFTNIVSGKVPRMTHAGVAGSVDLRKVPRADAPGGFVWEVYCIHDGAHEGTAHGGSGKKYPEK